MYQLLREHSVVRQDYQPFAVAVEPPYGKKAQAVHRRRQNVDDGALARVLDRGEHALRLVEDEIRRLHRRELAPVELHDVAGSDLPPGLRHRFAVYAHAPRRYKFLDFAPRARAAHREVSVEPYRSLTHRRSSPPSFHSPSRRFPAPVRPFRRPRTLREALRASGARLC